jgi:membrane-bound lytic murein transglycosylase B
VTRLNKFVLKWICYIGLAVLTGFLLLYAFDTIYAQNVDEVEEQLKEELERVEEEIEETTGVLQGQKAHSGKIEGQVNALKYEINQAQGVINQKSQVITRLGNDINIKEQTVEQLNAKMQRSKAALAELIRTTNKLDDISLPEVFLSESNLSEFFKVVDSLVAVQNSLDILFDEIRQLRGLTEEEKRNLENKKNKEADARAVVESKKKTVQVKKGEQDSLLAISKSVEKTYEQILAEKQAKAASIRSALFRLRDSSNISFGQALDFAQVAGKATGVRPAFILAILKQESNIGQNVGTCNRPGDPESKKWYNIMPGPLDGSWRDDQTNFLKITTQLGLDPESTPLSCPMGTGWGGAMGPSQFIPTTWLSYESRIKSALGVSAPNPWNPEHAFTATALYVADLGATAQTYTAERTAALKYYAGSNWSKPQNQFYGNQVLGHATTFQQNIDFLADVN